MLIIHVTDIKWEIDEDDDGSIPSAEDCGLPLSTYIEVEDEEEIADALSDKFGFLTISFSYDDSDITVSE